MPPNIGCPVDRLSMPATITNTLTTIYIVLGVVAVIEFIWIGARWLRIRRERRQAAKAGRQQQLIWRGDFIGALVQMVGQDTRPSRRLRRLREVLGWTEGHALLVLDSLTAKGLVEKVTPGATAGEPWATIGMLIGVRVRLTEEGLDEAERAEVGPTENLPRIVAYRSIVTVSGGDAAVLSPSAQARESAIDSPAAYGRNVATDSPGATQTLIEHGLSSHRLARPNAARDRGRHCWKRCLCGDRCIREEHSLRHVGQYDLADLASVR